MATTGEQRQGAEPADNGPESIKGAFRRLSTQHKAFVIAYLDTFNATKAARASGYSNNTATEQGYDLLRRPHIAAAVAEQLDKIGITEDRIKSEFAAHALDADIADYEDVLTRGMTLQEARRGGLNTKRIKKLVIRRKMVKDGDNAYPVEDVQLELHDPLRALEALAKVKAMFTERRELSGPGGEPLAINIFPDKAE